MANTNTFYYKMTVTPTGTGSGKVYVNTSSTTNPSYSTQAYSIDNLPSSWWDQGGETVIGDEASLSFYFYASPVNENSIFSHWAEGSPSGPKASTSASFSKLLTFNGSSRNPTNFNYYAVFTAQTGLIKVRSANESHGSASIDNPDNKENDVVTLTATPDVSNGVMFLGWKKNNEGNYISTNNPLTLTANSQTAGTYYACFSNAAEKVYIRLKNNKTGRFLSFYGDKKATIHQRTISGYTRDDGYFFTNSLKMISADAAQGNPSTVFLRSGHASGSGVTIGCNFSAHEVDYNTLINSDKYPLTMENHSGRIRIYTTYTYSGAGQSATVPSYLCDEGVGKNGDFAVMKTIMDDPNADEESTYWTLYSLDETTTEGAFGANTKAKFTKDGKYYTTMYTDFPYQLLDGVNAYYLKYNPEYSEITDRIVFDQVEAKNGVTIVPAETAVILECKDVQNNINETNTVKNRLLPLLPNAPGTGQIVNPGANYLKGYISVNGSTVANQDKFYVLSANKEDVLGFHPYTKSTMTPNKAYLDVRVTDQKVVEEHAKNVTFFFGEPEDNSEDVNPTGIELSDQIVDEDESTPVYNLNGSKVAEGKAAENMLRPGVYVKKGKKFVVK